MKKIKNILGVFLVTIVSILLIPNNVIAEEKEDKFAKYLNEDGKLEIKASFPKSDLDFRLKITISLIEIAINDIITFGENYPEDFKTIDLILNPEEPNEETRTVKLKKEYN